MVSRLQQLEETPQRPRRSSLRQFIRDLNNDYQIDDPDQTQLSSKQLINFITHLVAALILIVAVYLLAYFDQINLTSSKKDLKSFDDRLWFVLRYYGLHAFIMAFMVIIISIKRVTVNSEAFNPLAGHENQLQGDKNLLINTVEQLAIMMTAQLSAISFMDKDQIVRLIPASNYLFLIGRLFFVIGYPMNRIFGFLLSFGGQLPLIAISVYQFINEEFVQ